MKEHFLNISEKDGERKLAYTSWGDDLNGQVLLCVHGLSRNSRDFDFLAKSLADKYRIICIDVAGRGNSDWLQDKKRYNYRTYVADVLLLLKSLKINIVDWVGTSMGGIMGMMVAAQRPDLINKMVLNDIGSLISGEALDKIFKYVSQNLQFDSFGAACDNLKSRMATFGVSEDEHWQHILKHTIQERDGKYTYRYDPKIVQKLPLSFRILGNLKNLKRIGKCPDINLDKFWNAIQCPVFVMRGAESGILSEQTYKAMLASRGNVSGVQIGGVGHAPMLMDEMQISLIREWLV